MPFEVAPRLPKERNWLPLIVSALFHGAIILLLLFGIPTSREVPAARSPSEVVQPLAIAPPKTSTPTPQRVMPTVRRAVPPPPPPSPKPPATEQELGPNSTKPDAPAKQAAKPADTRQAEPARTAPPTDVADATPPAQEPPKPEVQPPAPTKIGVPRPGSALAPGIPLPTTSPWAPPRADSASGAPPPAPEPSTTSGMMSRSGLADRDPDHWEQSFDDETSGRCVEIPDLGKNPDGTPVLATVIGRVLDTDGRTPLGGAHLQILGTPFGTFSDDEGEYRLEFDPHLLARCRKQYVEVVAPGYAPQRLTLAIGPRVRSDDVVLRRH